MGTCPFVGVKLRVGTLRRTDSGHVDGIYYRRDERKENNFRRGIG